jgi:alginate O-acetyltransferase complex protein AlgJ
VMAERVSGSVFYRHDSHWTFRGALAGYNALVEADSHPDWRIDPQTALSPPTRLKVRDLQETMGVGDLTRLLGTGEDDTESVQSLTLPPARTEPLASDRYGDYVASSGKSGPTIMVIGDSFTGSYFNRMILQHAGRMIWLEHRQCAFDWTAIDRFHPDEVWWMPTERLLLCDPNAAPANFTG